MYSLNILSLSYTHAHIHRVIIHVKYVTSDAVHKITVNNIYSLKNYWALTGLLQHCGL